MRIQPPDFRGKPDCETCSLPLSLPQTGEQKGRQCSSESEALELFSRFDTLLIGRKSFEAVQTMGAEAGLPPGMTSVLISLTLRQADHLNVTIASHAEPFVADLKTKPGKGIWLFGGGEIV